eukprot:TRINITY_DN4207_c0_g1_i1.p1 TRINITY_DN4207_c0_g1~~TRINITY_DN4207_c0_g1_i1.p1  ORF type:complete len:208 (+),score=1.22 TRINITY_DN4207_c0_g1_i1:32-625(+)
MAAKPTATGHGGLPSSVLDGINQDVYRGALVAVVRTHWNEDVVGPLTEATVARLGELNVTAAVVKVSGSWELPNAAAVLAHSGRFRAVIAIGCLIKGDTQHFEIISDAVARGLMDISVSNRLPVIYGVLNANTLEQAQARADPSSGLARSWADAAVLQVATAYNVCHGVLEYVRPPPREPTTCMTSDQASAPPQKNP